MSGKARIGIIGAGFWAAYFYLPFLRDHPDAECVGVVRPEREPLEALKEGFDLDIATPDVQELLAAGCDGVIVSSANHVHREHAEAALRAGAHVLMEKPMTVTAEDATAVAALADECGLVLSMAHGWNYSTLATWAMDIVQDGHLGNVSWVDAQIASSLTNLFSGREGYGVIDVAGYPFAASSNTWARRENGGGYAYGQIVHLLGLALTLVDSPPREVFARMDILESGVDIADVISVEFENGAIGSFAGHGRLPWNTRYPLGLRVAGDAGVLTLDFERERADVRLQSAAVSAREDDVGERHRAFTSASGDLDLEPKPGDGLYDNAGPAQFLIDTCNGVVAVNRAPAKIGVRSVAIIEAAWQSALERRHVSVGVA
jgi:predicted dehydrogenase